MVNDDELGALVARHVFKLLDDPRGDLCQRIEGKGGTYPDSETKLGGLCESSLAAVVADALKAHRSY